MISTKLFKKFALLASGAVFFLSFSQNALAINLREELLFTTVQIVSVTTAGSVVTGAGTTISKDGFVLTNFHIVAEQETEEIHPQINICYTVDQYLTPRCAATAKVLALNKEFDLALIAPDKKIGKDGKPTKSSFIKYWKRSGNEFFTAPFKNTQNAPLPNILDKISIWGYPGIGGSTITVTQGYVSGFDVIENENGTTQVKFIKTDAEVSPGNSGGAAFNEWFSFIGVPSNAWPGQLGFIIPVQTAIEWLESLAKQKIINIKKIDSVIASRIAFSDISKRDPFQNVARLMNHLKIMSGFENGAFLPQQPLTNAEAVAIAVAAKRLPGETADPQCTAKTEAWYSQALCAAQNAGWIQGKINPNSIMRDDEFYDLLAKAFEMPIFKNTTGKPITRRQAANAIFELIAP